MTTYPSNATLWQKRVSKDNEMDELEAARGRLIVKRDETIAAAE